MVKLFAKWAAILLVSVSSLWGASQAVGGGSNTIGVIPVRTFLGLTDTPNSYSGQGAKVVSVKADESGLEFTSGSGGTPGGSANSIQYNNAGAFGGFGSWNGTTFDIDSGVIRTTGLTLHSSYTDVVVELNTLSLLDTSLVNSINWDSRQLYDATGATTFNYATTNQFGFGTLTNVLDFTGITAARTFTLPDVAGTIALTSNIPAFQTNGTPNPTQTLLNLVAGTNMTLTDDGSGNITLDAAGGGTVGPGTINEIAYFDTTTTIASLPVATYPSLTELSYVKGVTSSIQTQIDGKQATLSLTTTGTSGAATLVGATLNIPEYAGTTYPILQPNSRSVSLGVTALDSITTGDDNVAIGYATLTAGAGVNNTTAIGNYALTNAVGTSASSNTAIGYGAMRYITGAGEAVAIGFGAMGGNGTGTGADWSVAIGTDSLSSTTLTGAMNVAIGRRAGAGLTSGGQNILIGSRVAESLTSGGQNIGIGYFIDFPSATGNSQLKIGEGILGQNINTLATSVLGFGIASSTSSTLTLRGGTTAISSLRITSGVAPTSPVSGDFWQDGTHLYAYIGGGARQLDQQGGASFGTDNQIPYTNAGGTDFDYSANLTFDGNQIIAETDSTGVIPLIVRSSTSSQTASLFEVRRYDASPGLTVDSNTSVTIGGAYDYVNAKHAAGHTIRYANGGYTGGLLLNNISTGSAVRLNTVSNSLYITDNAGAATPLILGIWANPGDGTTFTASAGRWHISAGWLAVNYPAQGIAQIEATTTSIPQFGGFYDTSNYFTAGSGSTGNVTLNAVGSAPSFTFSDKVIFDNTAQLKGYTVAGLPAGTVGMTAYVTDALAPAWSVAVVGGGAVKIPVFYDGTNWIAH